MEIGRNHCSKGVTAPLWTASVNSRHNRRRSACATSDNVCRSSKNVECARPSLPSALQNQTDLASSGLQHIEVCLAPELKQSKRIVVAILSNRRRMVVSALNDNAIIVGVKRTSLIRFLMSAND